MTNGGTLQLAVTKPTPEITHVTVSVFHQKSGRNFLTGSPEAGGIYVSATPVLVKGNMVLATLGQGYKELAQATEKLSRSQLARVYDEATEGVLNRSGDSVAWQLVSKVCEATGLTIAK